MLHCSHRSAALSITCGVMLSAIVLSGCSGQVDTRDARLSDLSTGAGISSGQGESASVQTPSNTQVNMAVEEEVCNGTLKAWRKATSGDEKGAMADLNELDKKHPNVSTVQLMMGQVADHFGRRDAAVKYYRRSASGNEFSTMRMYKLADALRLNNKYDEAIPIFRKLVKTSEGFEPRLKQPFDFGLSYCLLHKDPKSKEGREYLELSLKENPEDNNALALQKEMAGK